MAATNLIDRVKAQALGTHVLATMFFGETPAFVTADGRMVLGGVKHCISDALLVTSLTRDAIISGGEDGVIRRTTADGTSTVLGEANGAWIDALATHPDGAVAWAAGKRVTARDAKGRLAHWQSLTAAIGLAFMPKGYRLAIAHYNGASLWFPATSTPPQVLAWKGSHLDCTVSPDGQYVVTSMQENALHGWRISDGAHMRMTGYPAKTRSMSWSHDGNWLATSGAEAAIIWPFSGKDGPMGKAPRECGARPRRTSCVAFHPGSLVLAIGYEDGWVVLVRLTDASELLVRAPREADKAGAITAFSWDAQGKRLAIGGADGFAGLLTLP
jgi:sugar lactone lactonase YvrE